MQSDAELRHKKEYLDPQEMLEFSMAGGASKLSMRQQLYLKSMKLLRNRFNSKEEKEEIENEFNKICNDKPGNGRFSKMKTSVRAILGKYMRFVGPGLMVSVAYMDPGNYSTDVSAGASNEYSLLCIVFISNIIATFLQSLCIKLGSATGLDLARACKEYLPRWMNFILYFFAECAIIATDVAEVIGTAIALNILLNIPLSAGVVITIIDVLFVLMAYKPGSSSMRFVRFFEYSVALLVLGVVICFCVELAMLPKSTSIGAIFRGFLPSKEMFQNNGMYTATSILGATVMPHSLFLGSGLVQPRLLEYDVDMGYYSLIPDQNDNLDYSSDISAKKNKARLEEIKESRYFDYRPTASAIKYALRYSVVELSITLLTFALFVNSSILIVSGATLYGSDEAVDADLYSIYDLLCDYLAPAAGTVFMLALLLSGQSAGIVCTIAGQIVSEGHLNWNFKPWKRRLITRGIAIIPCLVISLSIGKSALSEALNASQVVLSILLPFLVAPLIYFTCKKSIMRVRVNSSDNSELHSENLQESSFDQSTNSEEQNTYEYIDMSNNWITSIIAFLIWIFITMLNVYTIVELGISHGDIS